MSNNRRNFLKNSLLALGAAPLITTSFQKASPLVTFSEKTKIVTRKFGKTGLKLPIISMGTGDTNNPKLVEAALEKGIQLLATSQYYGNGNNEKMIGEAIKNKKRNSILIATSAMPDGMDHKEGMFDPGKTNPDAFIKKLDESLVRLGTDHVDIMFLPFLAKKESVFFEPYLKAMEKIKKDGKARFIGIATHKFEHEAIRAAADTKVYDLVMTAYNFRKANKQEIKEAIAYAAGQGLGIIAMKTMAGAYWDKERTKPINTKAALKWVLQDENIHTTVPGITTFDQLQQNIDLMSDLRLTEQENTDLVAFENNPLGIYCQQCGECVPQCSKKLDIPTIMRSYMYAYGYKNLQHAQETLRYTDADENYCSGCNFCTVNCKMNFDIKAKIADISRLSKVPIDFIA
jgi:predicted aldo/keto reductase-like oxidoreductase